MPTPLSRVTVKGRTSSMLPWSSSGVWASNHLPAPDGVASRAARLAGISVAAMTISRTRTAIPMLEMEA